MWNCDWEYQNQDVLKNCYERKMAGRPYGKNDPVRKIICEGCGCVFYTRIWSKKYCYYKKFTPKRSDALYCSNACRQRAYRQSVTDKTSGHDDHLLES